MQPVRPCLYPAVKYALSNQAAASHDSACQSAAPFPAFAARHRYLYAAAGRDHTQYRAACDGGRFARTAFADAVGGGFLCGYACAADAVERLALRPFRCPPCVFCGDAGVCGGFGNVRGLTKSAVAGGFACGAGHRWGDDGARTAFGDGAGL